MVLTQWREGFALGRRSLPYLPIVLPLSNTDKHLLSYIIYISHSILTGVAFLCLCGEVLCAHY